LTIRGVVFDLDGVLIESEQLWDETRVVLVRELGGTWRDDAQRTMMGMSTAEWTTYMHDVIGLPLAPEEIAVEVTKRLAALYRASPPVIAGAREAVERLSSRWPLAIASSSPRALIEVALEVLGVTSAFAATVSSEEVARGKPAPDVYLEALRRLNIADPSSAAGVEDSRAGLLALRAASMRSIAIPNRAYPPPPDIVSAADRVLPSITALDVSLIESL
jgi:HAD superfamily hydrolase (TIGR01509 family)